jgi:Tol biopolymer transport system component
MRDRRGGGRAQRLPLIAGAVALAAAVVAISPAWGGFPGDNGLIAYACGADICVVEADGTGGKTLVASATDPAWSADGLELAYVKAGVGILVSTVDSTGTITGTITTGAAATARHPTWSPDGLKIAYTNGGDIWTINADTTGGATNLTQSGVGNDTDPAWSPSGTSIAYASDETGGSEIYTMNANGSGQTRLTVNGVPDVQPDWSPDGTKLVFAEGTAPSQALWTVNSDGTGASRLGNLDVPGSEPAWSPDGALIAYTANGGGIRVVTSGGTSGADVAAGATSGAPDWQRVEPATQPGTGTPKNTILPQIVLPSAATSPTVGVTLSASVGGWTGTTPITYGYQWKKCESATGPCYDLAGATSSVFLPTTAVYGWWLRVMVTATNSIGSDRVNSDAVGPVTAIPPRATSTPQIVGDNMVGVQLTLTAGVWQGSAPLAFSYDWRRCNPPGDLTSCVSIPSGNAGSYTPTAGDIGSTLRVWITGKNVAGSDTAVTNHTFPIRDVTHYAPAPNRNPTITGDSRLGSRLVSSPGTWNGDRPITYTYQWQRCDAAGKACKSIRGATRTSYVTQTSDLGSTMRFAVVGTNTYGTSTGLSAITDPVMLTPPHVKGRRIVGTAKADYLAGSGHDDTILGKGGNDTLLGGAGSDMIEGGAGNDVVIGGSWADRLYGNDGSDTIFANDGERDVVDCGAGNDRAVVDAVDVTRNCEVVDPGPVVGTSTTQATRASPGPG